MYVAAAVGAATNVAELRDQSRVLRLIAAPQALVDLGALELTAENANPDFNPALAEPPSVLSLPFGALAARGDPPLGSYLAAASAYGALGYSVETIRAQPEAERARADALIAGALGVTLDPAKPGTEARSCRQVTAGADGAVSFRMPAGESTDQR